MTPRHPSTTPTATPFPPSPLFRATTLSSPRPLPPLHVLCIAAVLFVTGLLLSLHHTGETSCETCGTLLLLALLAAASVVDARTCVIPAIINGFLVASGIVTALKIGRAHV